ncbi:MAG: HIT domain-containing protein [Clostridia bacterium]|nr:HIT domain-containing protein [Clostridia bacterium]
MERLWAPWRSQYVESAGDSTDCFLCTEPQSSSDMEALILWRSLRTFVILNRFPYNSGHLLIAPYRHVKDFEQLTNEELLDLGQQVQRMVVVLKEVLKPQAFNIGLNLGAPAGAGLPGHLHVHIVPRWQGDTNFMPVTADTKVISEGLLDTWSKLRNYIDHHRQEIRADL